MPFWTGYRNGYHFISNPSASLSGFYADFVPIFASGRFRELYAGVQNAQPAAIRSCGAANLTVIRRPEANPAAAGYGLRWSAAWEAVTLTEPLHEALRTRLSPVARYRLALPAASE